jgi:short-subunit dehydrogenase
MRGMKKVIIIGASSGIGYELAKIFSENGFEVGIAARREEQLKQLQQELKGKSFIKQIDVAQLEASRQQFQELIAEMGGMDIIVLNSGVGWGRSTLQQELETIQVNVSGFVNLAHYATEYFIKKGSGHIVGVSSVASLRGNHSLTVYGATKAFMANYMEGLRIRFSKKKLNITVTDIRPGYVATPMTENNKGMFWVAPSNKAAKQIYNAILAKKEVAYITRRWAFAALLYKLAPAFLLKR